MERDNSYIQGTCLTMCPINETTLRLREKNLLHLLEFRVNVDGSRTSFGDKQRMVKEYARCAAGMTIKPCDVRPLPILLRTMKYLLTEVLSTKNVTWVEKYDFISNRLRAIQQDVIVQGLSGKNILPLLVPAVRFLVFSHYKLCENDVSEFDPHLNMKLLTQILVTILNILKVENYEVQDIQLENMREIETMLLDISMSEESFNLDVIESYFLSEEMESLQLLVHLQANDSIAHALELPTKIRSGKLLNSVIKACIAYTQGNYYRLLQLASFLPPILCCALHIHLCKIQRFALHVCSAAYSVPNQTYEINELCRNLLFNSPAELENVCLHYGIEITLNGVIFSKKSFNTNVAAVKPSTCKWIDEKLDQLDLSELFLR